VIRKAFAGFVILGSLYFLLLGGEYTFLDIWRLEREQEAEIAELEAVRAEVQELQAHADSLATDSAALERLAREQFGLIREGERLYRFVETDTTQPPPVAGSTEGEDNPTGQRPQAHRP
jgi:cell division protein FtsB